MLLQDNLHRNLPTAKDLPDSDDTPVDNQLPSVKRISSSTPVNLLTRSFTRELTMTTSSV